MFFQSACYQPVTILIVEQLLSPECTIRRGLRGVFWTAMPKASVSEDCEPMLPKDKIRIAKEFEMATPADDTMFPE